MFHKTKIMSGQSGIDEDRKHLALLKNSCKGNCLVVGHGNSIDSIDWVKYKQIPKLLINFYDPKIENIYVCLCWDKDIISYMNKKLINPISIFYSGLADIDRGKGNVHLDPDTFPPGQDKNQKIFTGARAIYLAQYFGFENIYLAGFDYIPHTKENKGSVYLAREKEKNHYVNNDRNVQTGLKNQMDCFQYVKWIHNNVFQTNPKSKLKYFKYKPLEEVLNG